MSSTEVASTATKAVARLALRKTAMARPALLPRAPAKRVPTSLPSTAARSRMVARTSGSHPSTASVCDHYERVLMAGGDRERASEAGQKGGSASYDNGGLTQ